MAIIRACSYQATIKTPEAPSNYSAILVTFSQENVTINKDETVLTIGSDSVIVKLDQTETKTFTACKNAYIQIRCYKSQYEAPGSKIWTVPVYPALNDEVLS